MSAYSPTVVEFARFIFENPGAQRKEIQEHLYNKTEQRWKMQDVYNADKRRYERARVRPMTLKEYTSRANAALFTPYYSSHLSDVEGESRNSRGKVMDWYRTVGENGKFCYWLTGRGLRLLTASVLPPSDARTFNYRDSDDYTREYKVAGESECANNSTAVVECKSEETPMSRKSTFQEDIEEISMQAWGDLASTALAFLKEDPGPFVDAIENHPDIIREMFGDRNGNVLINMAKVMRLTTEAAGYAEEVKSWNEHV